MRLRVFTMRNVLVFLAVCVLASTLSGGVILGDSLTYSPLRPKRSCTSGVGPFEAKLVTEGYFAYLCEEGVVGCTAQYDAIAPIFDGGFQMMTWFTCVGGMLLQRTGPCRLGVCAGRGWGTVTFRVGPRHSNSCAHAESIVSTGPSSHRVMLSERQAKLRVMDSLRVGGLGPGSGGMVVIIIFRIRGPSLAYHSFNSD